VAGDFYDVFRLSDGSLGLVVADVSGKGMGAALIMASVKAVLPLLAEGRSVRQTLAELNRKLSGELAPREFVALAHARYTPATGRFELANAGLPDPYRLRAGEEPEPLEVPGPRLPLGARASVAYESLEITLASGDRVLMLTDGRPRRLRLEAIRSATRASLACFRPGRKRPALVSTGFLPRFARLRSRHSRTTGQPSCSKRVLLACCNLSRSDPVGEARIPCLNSTARHS
jgi:hypothetical protein